MLFKGSGVALITPFKNGEVNYNELERLIEFQIKNSTDAIIMSGTTGEASTLHVDEQIKVIDFAVKLINKRVPVIAGTGSNNTKHAISLSKKAERAGVDGLLLVTPYYNKTTQKGLIEHFRLIADSVNIPIILYTVPGRTAVHLLPETVQKLSEHKNIIALKDATGDLSYTVKVKSLCDKDFSIYSGNDDVIIPVLSVGGMGVISVLANCMPKEVHDMVSFYLDGNISKAAEMQVKYKEFIDLLFIEPNPIPIKAVLDLMGYDTSEIRPPLTTPSEATLTLLKEAMKKLNISGD